MPQPQHPRLAFAMVPGSAWPASLMASLMASLTRKGAPSWDCALVASGALTGEEAMAPGADKESEAARPFEGVTVTFLASPWREK